MKKNKIIKLILKRENLKTFLYDIFIILIGTFIAAVGISLYLIPHRIAPGGITGLAQVLHVIFHWKTGVTMLVINIPIFILGVRIIGKIFGVKTIIGMVSISLFVDLLDPVTGFLAKYFTPFLMEIPKYTGYFSLSDKTILACIAGNVLLGAGLGIVFRHRGSTAGTDIPAAIIRKYTGLSLGVGFVFIDTVIIIFAGLVFKDPNLIIWAMVGLFISAKTCDFVMQGLPIAKTALIVSDKHHDIISVIGEELKRGTTVIQAEGGFTGIDKPIIFCVVSRKEVFQLQEIVKEVDENAFLVLYDAYDVLGRGFRPLRNVNLAGL